MKFDTEINQIKTYDKVYFTWRTWDNFSRRANPADYRLMSSSEAINKIWDRLPSICTIKINVDEDYPYPLVQANL